ncbi:ATP synthase subunit b, mitochondrial [Megalopta genalis]|uniref:ATP synthase subunit b, mitochondrial n=1 Tax=Megalopta genalis TaxID=115081 RepID=UPI003FD2DB2B
MLSRLAFQNGRALSVAVRGIQTSAPALCDIPRQKRPINPSPVKYGFIPEEWFTFFHSKTGISGPYVFLGTVGTYLVSKELYVLEHEYYNSLSLFMILIYGIKKYGSNVAEFLDKECQDYLDTFKKGRQDEIQGFRDRIKLYEDTKFMSKVIPLLNDVNRQNIAMQLEAVYRERCMEFYTEVKKRLDYHAQIDTVERRIAQKHMVQWIINNVMKSITPEQEKANLQQCIKDLESLAAKA